MVIRALLCFLALVALGAALYALHRLCLWLEEKGHLYYLRKQPGGSSASCLVELQKALEPQTRHVLHVKDEKRHGTEGDAGGRGEPPQESGPTP
jgi:hypothetical protein